jgi:hypothetical protein
MLGLDWQVACSWLHGTLPGGLPIRCMKLLFEKPILGHHPCQRQGGEPTPHGMQEFTTRAMAEGKFGLSLLFHGIRILTRFGQKGMSSLVEV